MPYLTNSHGRVVCVPEADVQRLLAEAPVKYMAGGKVAASRGYRYATPEEIASLREQEKYAEVEHGKAETERALRSKQFTSDLVEGIKSLASAAGGKKRAKDDQ